MCAKDSVLSRHVREGLFTGVLQESGRSSEVEACIVSWRSEITFQVRY